MELVMNLINKLWVFVVIFLVVSINNRNVSSTSLRRGERAVESYSNKYDNFDVLSVLSSARLVNRYCDCLMEKGPCPPEGKFLKEIIPDAIATECRKCSPIQKKQAGLILRHLLLNFRPRFLELCDKYDPSGKARKQYGIDVDDNNEDYEDYDEA
ncbi:hypothetical protein JTB14_036648 [Gonioctena quinquepunctata]|nr:hypothetical protein JTB14_036648 [Gonioctena quinquepunctata]